jgi:predicted nucleic acid-binding protein
LARLRFVGDYVRRSKVHFAFERDPTDAKFVEPAITGDATHILSADADLLSLRRARDEAARRLRQRLPRLQILSAGEFAHAYAL